MNNARSTNVRTAWDRVSIGNRSENSSFLLFSARDRRLLRNSRALCSVTEKDVVQTPWYLKSNRVLVRARAKERCPLPSEAAFLPGHDAQIFFSGIDKKLCSD